MTPSRAPGAVRGSRCRLIELGSFDEVRGSLCVADVGQHVDFEIQRVYWVFDVPAGHRRAEHAHREQCEILIATSGSFTVHCEDGEVSTVYRLDSPATGLLLPAMVFHRLEDFSPGAVCLALASGPYDPNEYVHDYAEFVELVSGA